MRRHSRCLSFACAALIALVLSAPPPAVAQDHSQIYTPAEIDADAERLATVIAKLNEIVRTVLTPEETEAIKNLVIEHPRPVEGDKALNFYAFSDFGERVVVMPLMSLKMLEDVTTAYAYLLTSGYSPGTIDLYFTLLQRKDPASFPRGRYPALLPALGVPADAWKHPPVDDLSLRLRNEAFAFAFFHELGHVVLKHRGYEDITTEQALADEIAADRFALDIFQRTGTPVLGASLLFQAQAYSLPHRGQFASEEDWRAFIKDRGTHPVTTDRLRAFADYVSTELAQARPGEREIWTFIGGGMSDMAEILDDPEMQRCMATAAETAPIDVLAPRQDADITLFRRLCG